MWRNLLSDEGKNIAKSAERAQDAGEYVLARELYIKSSNKFKQAAEICEDFNEVNILRTLASYYNNRAASIEKEKLEDPKSGDLQPHKGRDNAETLISDILNGTDITEKVFESAIKIAIEISSEGREGRSIGTAFIVGDAANVMVRSRQLVMNPFAGYRREERNLIDTESNDNIKEFAQLDGVFVISGDGVLEAACRYITIDTGNVKIPKGLGTRHSSVAAMTMATASIGIVVSQSGGVIRIFKKGKILATLKP